MDLWVREARIFKFGSGTGSNFSNLRGEGEKLSGGGTSSGLMSFLRVGDRAAGAIKSRRHDAPRGQDGRARSRSSRHRRVHRLESQRGTKGRRSRRRFDRVREASQRDHEGREQRSAARSGAARSGAQPRAARPRCARRSRWAFRQATFSTRSISRARATKSCSIETYDTNWDSKAYGTVSGQNSNNSVRIPNEFFARLDAGQNWDTIAPHRRPRREIDPGRRSVGKDRARRLAVRRSRPAVRHDDQRMAHLPERRPHQRQ